MVKKIFLLTFLILFSSLVFSANYPWETIGMEFSYYLCAGTGSNPGYSGSSGIFAVDVDVVTSEAGVTPDPNPGTGNDECFTELMACIDSGDCPFIPTFNNDVEVTSITAPDLQLPADTEEVEVVITNRNSVSVSGGTIVVQVFRASDNTQIGSDCSAPFSIGASTSKILLCSFSPITEEGLYYVKAALPTASIPPARNVNTANDIKQEFFRALPLKSAAIPEIPLILVPVLALLVLYIIRR